MARRAGGPVITPEISRFLEETGLGYVATVSPGGIPNVSPKGTIRGWDGQTLVFADIRSPDTIRNIGTSPAVEISVVDPALRRGYLFEGRARIARDGPGFEGALAMYRRAGMRSPVRAAVFVDVSRVTKVTSPLHDGAARGGLSRQPVAPCPPR